MIKLTATQTKALEKAMKADQQRWFAQVATPERGYPFPMDHTQAVVEKILNAPATRRALVK